eukprot:6174260-Pleurochrysis_carterae.AAC.1
MQVPEVRYSSRSPTTCSLLSFPLASPCVGAKSFDKRNRCLATPTNRFGGYRRIHKSSACLAAPLL